MNIAIINKNPLIATLIEMSLKGRRHSTMNIDMSSFGDGRFDLAIVDDASYGENILTKFSSTRIVALVSFDRINEFEQINGIWRVLRKPFMPAQIGEIIDSVDEILSGKIAKKTPVVVSAKIEKPVEQKEISSPKDETTVVARVLDNSDVKEIQELLNNDFSIDNSEPKELVESDKNTKDEQRQKDKKSKKFIKDIFDKNKNHKITEDKEEKILDALLNMKRKKLRKLLEDTELSIKIKFPKDNK